MRFNLNSANAKASLFVIIICLAFGTSTFAQFPSTEITHYVVFGGKKEITSPAQTQPPTPPGYAVQLGSSCNIQGGSIGSYHLVKSTGNLTLGTNIYSGGLVQLANSNVVTGKITAANLGTLPSPVPATSPVLSIGSSAMLGDNIKVNGSIVIGGGSLSGTATYPGLPYTYSIPGMPPGTPLIEDPIILPVLPEMPDITSFPSFPAGSPFNFSNTRTISPSTSYGDITLNGNKTLTFGGPGTYVINKIANSGTSNNFVFDFRGLSGNIIVYVNGIVDLGKIKASIIGGGSESRIFLETHGVGTAADPVAFRIANGSAGNASKWVGTVWAPYAAINIGSGTGSTNITGALWSATQVNIQSGISMLFAPYNPCGELIVSAGPDKAMEVITKTKLKGTSSGTGATFHWVASNGGHISEGENTDEITVTAAGTYTLTVTSGSCSVSDIAIVSGKVKNLIGSELQTIYETRPTSSPFFIIDGGYVMIDVIVEPGKKDFVLNLLQQRTPTYPVDYGLRNFITNGQQGHIIITGEYPMANLLNLNTLDSVIKYCRPYYQAVNYFDHVITGEGTSAITGLVTSAGDVAMRTNLLRSGYKLDGSGIKVGVISNSFATITTSTTATLPYVPTPGVQSFNTNTANQDTANGDLPGSPGNLGGYTTPVHIVQEYPGFKSDEGRAMLQIVHDVAPGAELYFRHGFYTAGDFATAIYQLADSGCHVLVDDITYITEPFLKDGVVAKAVDSVKKRGVTYFSSAGNFANRSYEANFTPVDTSLTGFTNKKIHDFDPAPGNKDLFQHVRLAPGNYTVVFQWADDIYSLVGGLAGTKFDMDIYLTPNANTDGTGLIGFNRDNKDGDPIEIMPFTIGGTDSVDYNFLIVQNTDSTSSPARAKIVIFRGGMRIVEYNAGGSTLVGQANADGAIAVGAARYNKVAPYVPVPLLEDFSSIGGTQTNDVVRNKPDIVGPDGVNTTVKMGQDYPNSALDGYSNFFGTSAAAPHAAAAAALIIQGKKKFLNQNVSVATPNEMRSLLRSTAIDMASSGFDYNTGFGFINPDSAMRTFAAPVSYLIQLVVPPGTSPCSGATTPFTIIITGENFSRSTIVLLINSPGDTTRIIPTYISSSEVSVTIPGCIGNPEIRAYTPPKPGTNGTDGGYSNSVYFFDTDIIVQLVNDSIKYGQTTPVFIPVVKIIDRQTNDTTLLQDTTLSLADIGLANLAVNVPALATNPADVGNYAITPYTTVPIAVEFLRLYNYRFIGATYRIDPLPLTVTALNIPDVIYGDDIPNIQFSYNFNQTGISNPDSLLATIIAAHDGQLATDLQGNDILGLVNGRAGTIENGRVGTIENGRIATIENGRTYAIENGDTIPIVNAQSLTIENGIVVDMTEYELTNSDIQSLSFLATEASLQNIRLIPNSTGSTTVVDITQESILNFNVNAAQTYMLSSVANVDPKGMVDDESYANSKALAIENGRVFVIENGIEWVDANGRTASIENGQAVFVNENGDTLPVVSSQNRTAVIVNANEVGNGLSSLKSLNIITGLSVGPQFIIPGAFKNSNYHVTYIAGTTNIKKDTITVTAENKVKLYGEENPALTLTYSGFANGEDLETSGITGTPVLSTTATITSPVGSYPITVANGSLTSENYAFKFVNGILTVQADPCLLIRPPFNNFGSTPNPQSTTSLWVNVAVKISGQLKTHGRYLSFTKGAITLKDINATDRVTGLPIVTKNLPDGKVMADANVTTAAQIYTEYNSSTNTWTTHVPLRFSSTSDIFISGGIINSRDGFVKKKNNANSATILQGVLSSDTVYSDQWTYALATYRPYFEYAAIEGTAGTGKVVAINGAYRAGTPLTATGAPISTLVNGGSGGGGNNYTGSTSSFDNFTACCSTCPAPLDLVVASSKKEKTKEEILVTQAESEVRIIPNPASDHITLSFVPAITGRSKVVLFTIDGKKISESDFGVCEAEKGYQKQIDVSSFINGIYLVQLWNGNRVTNKKIIISR